MCPAIGRRRAEQGVPLEVMLRTFRLGGRIVWEALVDQAHHDGADPGDDQRRHALVEGLLARRPAPDHVPDRSRTAYVSLSLSALAPPRRPARL